MAVAKIFLSVALLLAACARGERNSVIAQARLLGDDVFSEQRWAHATQEARGRMTASFLQKVDAAALTGHDVRRMLGGNTGYYDYDHYPAYIVGPRNVRSEYGHGYLLVFVTDHSNGQVLDIRFIPEIRADNLPMTSR